MSKIERYVGSHLRLVEVDRWEYVERTNATDVVAVVAVTDDDELVLVEQRRPPLGRSLLELPAGLVGDLKPESVVAAAQRELKEEADCTASDWTYLGRSASSPGLTNETIAYYLATGLAFGERGRGDSEIDNVRLVPLSEVGDGILHGHQAHDAKIVVGLWLLSSHRGA